MKKLRILVILLVSSLALISISCKKDLIKEPPQQNNYRVFMSVGNNGSNGNLNKAAVNNGQIIFLPDSQLTVLFWTEPLSLVNWSITGPQGQIWTNMDQISFRFDHTGTYVLNISSFGVNWNVTIIVGGNPADSQVWVRFVESTFSSNNFHYRFRMNKPSFVMPGDVLFRITELASNTGASYDPIYNSVIINGDSIDVIISVPPSGSLAVGYKFIAGKVQGVVPIWFDANPLNPYKCQDAPPLQNNIFHANFRNGIVIPGNETMPALSGPSPGSADYSANIPVILTHVNPSSGMLNIWMLSSSSPEIIFRYKTDETNPIWTELLATNVGGGYFNVSLPNNPVNGYYLFDYGVGIGANFVRDPMVTLSGTYHPASNALRLHL